MSKQQKINSIFFLRQLFLHYLLGAAPKLNDFYIVFFIKAMGHSCRFKKSKACFRWKWKKKRTRRLQRKRRKMRQRAR